MDAETTYELIRTALAGAADRPGYPALLRRLCLLIDAEKARLQDQGRFWCAQSIPERKEHGPCS
jgi:hypothetical protein